MALDLNSLVAEKATIDVDVMGQSTEVTYNPAAITAQSLENNSGDNFLPFFCEVVVDWDVTKGKKKVPLTEEALKGVPMVLLRTVFLGIMQHTGSGESGKASSDG